MFGFKLNEIEDAYLCRDEAVAVAFVLALIFFRAVLNGQFVFDTDEFCFCNEGDKLIAAARFPPLLGMNPESPHYSEDGRFFASKLSPGLDDRNHFFIHGILLLTERRGAT